jgi:predicted component of type VI protein secretion system
MELLVRADADASSASGGQHQIPLDGGAVVLGRGPESPVPLEDTRISRQHISFSVQEGRLCVTDISSSGVWINERPAPKRSAVPVEPFDEIRIPGYRISASVKGLEPAPTPAVAEAAPAPKPPDPAWWKPDGRERWALYLLAATGVLFFLYRSL